MFARFVWPRGGREFSIKMSSMTFVHPGFRPLLLSGDNGVKNLSI